MTWMMTLVAACPSAVLEKLSWRALELHDLSSCGCFPGPLWAGGITNLFEFGWTVDAIKFAGGWAAERPFLLYLNEAGTDMTLLDLTLSRPSGSIKTQACCVVSKILRVTGPWL